MLEFFGFGITVFRLAVDFAFVEEMTAISVIAKKR